MIDNSEIQLQENIPLNKADIKHIERQQAYFKKVPLILAICVLVLWALMAWFITDNFANFHYYDYLLYIGSGFAMYAFCYLIFWLLKRYDKANWKKDILHGKNRLVSIVIKRDKTEYAPYLTFTGKSKDDDVRLRVSEEDYSRYQIGARVRVDYLKFSKEALELIEF